MAALASRDGPLARWTAAADAWCAAALWPRPAAIRRRRQRMDRRRDRRADDACRSRSCARRSTRAREIAAEPFGAFHWELAFPEVFFDADGQPAPHGGFDAVIGNPPWDMLRADTGSSSQRSTRDRRPRRAALLPLVAVLSPSGHGHPNSYQLFLDRALQLTRPAAASA